MLLVICVEVFENFLGYKHQDRYGYYPNAHNNQEDALNRTNLIMVQNLEPDELVKAKANWIPFKT